MGNQNNLKKVNLEKLLKELKETHDFESVNTLRSVERDLQLWKGKYDIRLADDEMMAVDYTPATDHLTLKTTYSSQVVDYDWIVRAEAILQTFQDIKGEE